MNHSSRTSQRGFSLVELMVVVAIIGVLASIAIPSVNKYIAKARQTEAKTNLSSLYTSEKAFYAEYSAYDARFQAVAYSPEGQLRYNVGFSSNAGTAIATANNGYTFNGTNQSAQVQGYCGTNGTMTNGCSLLNGAKNAQPTAIANAVVNNVAAGASTFIAQARAQIHSSSPNEDVWTINEVKVLTNTTSGIQ